VAHTFCATESGKLDSASSSPSTSAELDAPKFSLVPDTPRYQMPYRVFQKHIESGKAPHKFGDWEKMHFLYRSLYGTMVITHHQVRPKHMDGFRRIITSLTDQNPHLLCTPDSVRLVQ